MSYRVKKSVVTVTKHMQINPYQLFLDFMSHEGSVISLKFSNSLLLFSK